MSGPDTQNVMYFIQLMTSPPSQLDNIYKITGISRIYMYYRFMTIISCLRAIIYDCYSFLERCIERNRVCFWNKAGFYVWEYI